jgi:predicted transcriptional regulator
MKPRHHLYLDAELTAQLEALAAKPGTSKSAIVADALRAYIERRGAREIDDLLKIRLDRITAEQRRTTRNINVVIESLSLFIHYQFSLTAQIPEPDAAARAVGRDRFQKFIDQISRQLASGKTSIGDDGEGAA